jgi:Na+/proline symporter
MMSTLLTDLLQGVMCLVILGFFMLPYLWKAAGGYEALRSLPTATWDLWGPGMSVTKVLALNVSAIAGGIAAPWIYNWIAISKNEQTATQCAWAHLWKRIVTLMFALYGIFFAILAPKLANPELAWGMVMKSVLPAGAIGLMIASFFAAAMSSAATYATTSSAMLTDYFYRRFLRPGQSQAHYLLAARIWCVVSILIAATSTLSIERIKDYVELCLSMLCFLGIPIYVGVVWRKANQTGMWLSLILGIGSFVGVLCLPVGEGKFFANSDDAFAYQVFIPTLLSIVGMFVGCIFGPEQRAEQLHRFYVIMNTPIGQEQRLIDAGIHLPTLVDAGLVPDGPETVRPAELARLYRADAEQKIFGPESAIELRRERLPWYLPGFIRVTASCVLLIVLTWLVPRIFFVWR